jgi:hypothetical protein
LYGVISNPKFTGVTGTVTGVIGVQSNPQYNSSGSITNFSALITNIAIGTSGTGAITSAYSNRAQAPTISAAAAITNFYQYFAAEAAPGSGTITTAYSYYGSQTTASGATNNWNLYMTGNAPNYLAGALNVGSTTLTNAPVYFAPSTTLQYNFMQQGTNTYASGNPIGFYINPNINATATNTFVQAMTGLAITPIFGPQTGQTNLGNLFGTVSNCYLNTTNAPTTVTLVGTRSLFTLAAAATVTNTYAFLADTPSITAAATTTTAVGFYAANITKGSGTITTAYAFYGNQGTGSATNSWNLYMAGAAPNYLAGQLSIGSTVTNSAYILAIPTTSLQYGFSLLGTNTNVAPSAMLINTTLSGTTGSSALIGLNVIPIFSPLVAVTNALALTSTAYLNSSFAPSNAMAYRGVIQLTANSLTGTIGAAYTFSANAPAIDASATTAITSFYQFYAANVAGTAGSAISSAYAFYGNQASSNTGVTNNWNLYMNGTAPNYLKGSLYLGGTTATAAILTGRSAANLTLGLADAAAPVAQTLSVQNVVAGTTDTAGTNFTITGSRGTGTGVGGDIIFQTAAASTTGSTQNALATALTIASTRAVTISAPSSGSALIVNGVAGGYAGNFQGANSATGTGLAVIGNFTGSGTSSLVSFQDTNNTLGVNLQLVGDGATTPNKTLRVQAGSFQILNSAYSASLLTITDAGATTLLATTANNVNVTSTTIPVNGIYLPAANSLGFATNTTLKATLDSSGNLYVGATSLPTDLTTNTTNINTGAFRTASMTTASTASGTAVTIFAIPANATGVYLIQATLSAVADAPNYTSVGILVTNAASYKYTAIVTGTLMAVAVSGSNLQATQISGAAKVITATATRFA